MMTVGIPALELSVEARIHSAIRDFQLEASSCPKRLGISGNLMTKLKREFETMFGSCWRPFIYESQYRHEIFGLPIYTIVEDDIIIVGL